MKHEVIKHHRLIKNTAVARDRWVRSLERREAVKSAGLSGGGSCERLMSSTPGGSTFPVRPHRPQWQEGAATCLHKHGLFPPWFCTSGTHSRNCHATESPPRSTLYEAEGSKQVPKLFFSPAEFMLR